MEMKSFVGNFIQRYRQRRWDEMSICPPTQIFKGEKGENENVAQHPA